MNLHINKNKIPKFDWQKYLIKLFDNPLGRWYLGVPKGKHIYKITGSSAHYYTGELSKRNGAPVICTGGCSAGGRKIEEKILKLSRAFSLIAFLPFLPKTLLPLIALTDTGFKVANAYQQHGAVTELTNPDYVYADDTNYATCFTQSIRGNDYKGFDFNLPSGATISGIEATIKMFTDNGTANNAFSTIRLTDKNGATKDKTVSNVTTTETTYTLGGSADLWGGDWDYDWLNGFKTNYRYYLSCDSNIYSEHRSINFIQLKVYYTESSFIPRTTWF